METRAEIKVDLSIRDNAMQYICAHAYAGDLEHIKIIIQHFGNDPDVMNMSLTTNETPIFLAAFKNHANVVRALAACACVDVNAVTTNLKYENYTPLHAAASLGHVDSIRALAERADLLPNAKNLHDTTALHLAIYDCPEIVPELLKLKGIDVNLKSQGFTPLTYTVACINRGVDRNIVPVDVAALIQAEGVALNEIITDQNLTPLMIAVMRGHMAVVRALLNAGADKDYRHPEGNFTALTIAVSFCREDIAEVIRNFKGVNAVSDLQRSGVFAYLPSSNSSLATDSNDYSTPGPREGAF